MIIDFKNKCTVKLGYNKLGYNELGYNEHKETGYNKQNLVENDIFNYFHIDLKKIEIK